MTRKMNIGPEHELILRNQLAIMYTLRSVDWKLTTGTRTGPESTWCHSVNGLIDETKRALGIPTGDT